MIDNTPQAMLYVYPSFTLRRSQRWRWRLVEARSRNIVATSGEGYANRAECERIGTRVTSGGYDVNIIKN